MGSRVKIGVIDSGISLISPLYQSAKTRRFYWNDDQSEILNGEMVEDTSGHGTHISNLILKTCPDAEFYHAQAFSSQNRSSPQLISAALEWLISQKVEIINASFGLTRSDDGLSRSCERVHQSGIFLVASAPAHGEKCYPANYPSALAVTGDARCHFGEVSFLDHHALFGTFCYSPEQGGERTFAGASSAAAHFSGLLGRYLNEKSPAMENFEKAYEEMIAFFKSRAVFSDNLLRPHQKILQKETSKEC